MEIIESLNWRYATKVFDKNKEISDTDLQKIKDIMRLSASSFGLQPWKFLIVEDKKIREKLKPVSWGQSQITDASILVVMCRIDKVDNRYIEKYLDSIIDIRG